MSRILKVLGLLAYTSLSLSSNAETVITSGPERVSLLELYTSQGCSSCPPADQWLSGLRGSDRLWREVVPVAFHVDYWNRLGWPDPFSRASHSERQRLHHRQGNTSGVYTPGFLVDGQEWRGYFRGTGLPSGSDAPGRLLVRAADEQVVVTFQPQHAEPGDAQLLAHVGLVGVGHQTHVRAGENHGRRLQHDFVLLDYASAVLSDGKTASLRPLRTDVRSQRQALVAWVSRGRELAPLQAAGGWIH